MKNRMGNIMEATRSKPLLVQSEVHSEFDSGWAFESEQCRPVIFQLLVHLLAPKSLFALKLSPFAIALPNTALTVTEIEASDNIEHSRSNSGW